MKMCTYLVLLALSVGTSAQDRQYYLGQDEQPFFKNDPNGQNHLDRIDNNVRELNRLNGEVVTLKQQLASLEERIKLLEQTKK
jgi:hypothetical protein